MIFVAIFCGLVFLLSMAWRMISSSSPQVACVSTPEHDERLLPLQALPDELKNVCYTMRWDTMILPFCPLCGSQHPSMEHIGLKFLADNHTKQVRFFMICKDRSHAIPFRYSHCFETCDDGSLWYAGSTANIYQFRHSVLDDNFSKEEWAALN